MKTEFTEKEISFIKERQYPFNFDSPSDDDWDALLEWAAYTLMCMRVLTRTTMRMRSATPART